MLTDLPESALWEYRSSQVRPDDFDEFWDSTMAEARALPIAVEFEAVASGLAAVDTYDLSFAGFGGDRVHAWLRVPRWATGRMPVVLQFPGYGSGRGHVLRDLLWSAAGYVHLSVDVRGQTGGQGFLVDGLESPHDHYYRRAYTDSARAVEAARSLEFVDAARVALVGDSQGGGLALAAAALDGGVSALVVQAPFLSDLRRASEITDSLPYGEIGRYLAIRRDQTDRAHRTLSYVDGVNLASRATAPTLFSTGLMDDITPPSTVFGAFHAYAGPKRMVTWPYSGHEAGGQLDSEAALAFVAAHLAAPDSTHTTHAGDGAPARASLPTAAASSTNTKRNS
jgi:cephalosporin-C deacetylase